ncbi:MAG TPA: hypothetical protein ENK85_06745 [Saprospiraceae bacterium]|nr:hypothetical protein [Saprospiraceae bacterium]
MKTLILSSSLSPKSRSFLLCQAVNAALSGQSIQIDFVDLRDYDLAPVHRSKTADMERLTEKVKEADNIIIGMGVHCYSINDGLKIVLDTCFGDATNKFFGIVCAAGGEKSYLSTMHLTQICMNEWRMIQLPRVIYATGQDFVNDAIANPDLKERIGIFAKEFYTIGQKLLAE